MHLDSLVVTSPFRSSPLQMLHSFVQPTLPVNYEPLQAAAVLENSGFKVKYLPLENIMPFFDPEKDLPNAKRLVAGYNSDVIVFLSSLFLPGISNPTYPFDIHLADYVKSKNPNTKIVLAGSHASYLPVESMKDSPAIDSVILFEPEPVLADVVETYAKGQIPEHAKGVVFRDKKGRIVTRNSRPNVVKDLDRLPVPAYRLLKDHFSTIVGRRNKIDLLLMTSRGCSFHCAFCASTSYTDSPRFFSAEHVGTELDCIKEMFGSSHRIYAVMDNNFTLNKKHVIQVAEEFLVRDMSAQMFLSNVTTFDRDVAACTAKFCKYVYFGAESSTDRVLDTVGKKQKFSSVVDACLKAKSADLKTTLNFIIGLPGEDNSSMSRNLAVMAKMKITGVADNVSCSVLVPYPGSDLYGQPEKYGITILHKRWDSYGEAGFPPVYMTDRFSDRQIFCYYMLACVINQFSQRPGMVDKRLLAVLQKYIGETDVSRLENSLRSLMQELEER